MIIHAGDFTGMGRSGEVDSFIKWYSSLSYKYKVVIAGNHEVGLYQDNAAYEEFKKRCNDNNINLLHHEAIELNGFKIFGSPYTPKFGNWAWMYERSNNPWNLIPEDTQILITHGPPFMINDLTSGKYNPPEHAGCEHLYRKIQELRKLKLHVFGHIHEASGVTNRFGVTYVNASICDLSYVPSNKPTVIDL